ncbi:hypothetical protein U737_21635 [Methylomonas sp. LW13]|uniref:hypothetical protein n=1 Tax=unclassified Methylomonas TaxID=2608980 RepID=UPI00051C2502|nr:hypothetical protein [Methylomonas sp. LW13]QBC29307.1 hypothetical protein U737_21635 [Methylomonas sp. LW13]
MSKIVIAANAMIANAEKISTVIPSNENKEFFYFLYGKKYTWGIYKDGGAIVLLYFPNNESPDYLAALASYDFSDVSVMRYSSLSIGSQEAEETFRDLYTIIQEKAFGIDKVLDEIIGDFDIC